MEWFNSASTLTKAMITAGALLALLLAAAFATRSGGSESIFSESPAPVPTQQLPTTTAKNPQVQTVVVREDAGGYTNNDLTPDTMKLIENELVERTIRRGQEHIASQGLPPNELTPEMVRATSWVMEASGRRFGVVDMHAGQARIKAIVSIDGTQFVRVSCIDPSGNNVPTFTGPCADKIQEVFGVMLPAAN